jgi:hypothetical protein
MTGSTKREKSMQMTTLMGRDLAGRKDLPMMASSAVLMDQDGCHVSGWNPDMERQIFLPTVNRPFG